MKTMREKDLGYCEEAQTYCSIAEEAYQQGRADASFEEQYKQEWLTNHDKEIRAEERAKTIEFVVDKIIFPLLNEYDIKLWEDIDYIELAEKWVEFVNERKGENDDIANDLKNWIAEQMEGGAE